MFRYPKTVSHQSKQGILNAEISIRAEGIYRTTEDFHYSVLYRGKTVRFFVPSGFYTNFATIPTFMKPFLSPMDKGFIVASVVHDFVLNEFKDLQPNLTRVFWVEETETSIDVTFGWNEAAELFRAIMEQEESFNKLWRDIFTTLVKSWFVFSPYVRNRFTF